MTGNACTVLALELIGTTGDVLAMWRLFIVTIRTIYAAIAQPASVYASDSIVTLVFGLQTQRNGTHCVITALERQRK